MLLGVLMTDQQELLTKSLPRDVVLAPWLTRDTDAERRQEGSGQGHKSEYEAQLRLLQQYICELLIKNQRLRWSLKAATNHQCEDFPDDHDQNVTRDQS